MIKIRTNGLNIYIPFDEDEDSKTVEKFQNEAGVLLTSAIMCCYFLFIEENKKINKERDFNLFAFIVNRLPEFGDLFDLPEGSKAYFGTDTAKVILNIGDKFIDLEAWKITNLGQKIHISKRFDNRIKS